MLTRFFRFDTTPQLNQQIDAVTERMASVDVESVEYEKLMKHLTQLHELKAKDRRAPVSRDTMVICLTNLAGIIIIVAYEHAHVVTSKALGQLNRPNATH